MKRLSVLISVLVTLTVLLSACGAPAPVATEAPAASQAPAETEAPAAGPVVLKVASGRAVTTWDPIASASTEATYLANVYEQLLRVNPPGSAEKYTPLLAESWEPSDDGLLWTFKLRPGVKFHDGEPMNAEAVKKSLEANMDHGGYGWIWPVKSVEAVDELTVAITLSTPQPLELIAGSEYSAYIVSPKALDAAAADENYWSTGVSAGTGPYKVESYTADKEIVFTQNTEYWGGWEPGQYEKVLVQLVPEPTTQQQMLEGGEVDLATRIPSDAYATFKTNPDYQVLTEPSLFNYVGFFNTLRPPLDNVKVRQALSYAIPYEDIIKLAVNGRATQSRGPAPAGVFPASPDVKQYTYDIEKAKELLKEAGHEGGGFSLKLTYASANDVEATFAPLIKDSFAQLGVEVSIEPLAWSEQWELAKTDPPNAQDIFLLWYWPTYSDAGADNLRSLFYGTETPSFNLSYWNNADYNALLDEASTLVVTDPVTSQAKYTEAQNLVVEEAPGLFFFDAKAIFVIPNRIEGFKYNLNYPDVDHWYYELRPAR